MFFVTENVWKNAQYAERKMYKIDKIKSVSNNVYKYYNVYSKKNQYFSYYFTAEGKNQFITVC